MRFVKMEGLGNDFVVFEGPLDLSAADVAAVCDRRRGVGADGVLVVTPAGEGVRMQYWNADGSPAEMCGNGLRCVARFAVDRGMVSGPEFVVDTPAGPRQVRVGDDVTVDLGPVRVADTVTIDGADYHTADVGNPHAVRLVDDPDGVPVAEVGARVGRDASFPEGANVEFVAVAAPDRIRLRVWERGVGETLACGTGAVASVAVGHRLGATGPEVAVELPGGTARVRLDGGHSWLTGPVRYVFEGDWPA